MAHACVCTILFLLLQKISEVHVVSGSQGQFYIMDEDMEAPDHVEQLDGAIVKRKRVEEGNVDINAKPASKATGKPVLNTRALRSVLKGGYFYAPAQLF